MTLAWLALAGAMLLSAGPAVFGHPSTDAECLPVFSEVHDHAAHRLRAADDDGPAHCLSCHLTRTATGVWPRVESAAPVVPDRASCDLARFAPNGFLARPTFTRGPPR